MLVRTRSSGGSPSLSPPPGVGAIILPPCAALPSVAAISRERDIDWRGVAARSLHSQRRRRSP
eukprot:6484652-Pyramimonas_sp.AAC.1